MIADVLTIRADRQRYLDPELGASREGHITDITPRMGNQVKMTWRMTWKLGYCSVVVSRFRAYLPQTIMERATFVKDNSLQGPLCRFRVFLGAGRLELSVQG